ncbi:MAG: hypothetical protein M3R24_05190, partial [Chloroflexota bacterium]|nr:hypothetical protein [Chloroflexota bacterium]
MNDGVRCLLELVWLEAVHVVPADGRDFAGINLLTPYCMRSSRRTAKEKQERVPRLGGWIMEEKLFL